MLDDLRRLTLLAASLGSRVNSPEMLQPAFTPSALGRRTLYARIAQKTMMLLASKPGCGLAEHLSVLKLILASHTKLEEKDLLTQLLCVLGHVLVTSWNEALVHTLGQPRLLQLLHGTPGAGRELCTTERELCHHWLLARRLSEQNL
jgi:hypothetical protein